MELWLLVILLGLITYFIVKRSVANISQTPVWLLWLVLMTPGLIWCGWSLAFGEDQPIPPILRVGPLVTCPLLYWWLIQLGRPKPKENQSSYNYNTRSQYPPSSTAKSPEQRQLSPISKSEETALRNCFPWGLYYLQQIDYRPQAILCLGKLLGVSEEAYTKIKTNVEEAFGDRFLVIFQESLQGKPFFALVANPFHKSPQNQTAPLTRPILAVSLLLISLFTTTVIGVQISGTDWSQVQSDPMVLLQGLPYSLAIVSILGCHELSHYLTAIYYKIRTTLPYFIPDMFFLGTLGAFIQKRSPIPHRKALFDVAIAGPIMGLVVTVPLLLWGLSLSHIVELPEQSNFLNFEALDPRFSFLLSLLGKIALGSQFTPGVAIALHPLAVAGYIGLIFTALKLMPVGKLDGGSIVHAVFGQLTAFNIGQVTRLLMFLLALIQRDFLIFAIILLLLPPGDQPALNDVTELDNWRDISGFLCLILLISILLPLPEAVAQWLNI